MPTRYPARDVDAAPLGQPLTFPFSGRVAPNRFLKASLTERMASWDPTDVSARGIPTDELVTLYRNWGAGGWGLVLSGNVLVHPEHIEAPGNMIVGADQPFEGPRFEAYQRLAAAGKEGNSLFVAQVNHPGRQVIKQIQSNPVSASDVQLVSDLWGLKFAKPHAATPAEIQVLKDTFIHTAVYLEKAGFDGIQLHAAHGYLLAQFLSLTTNRRTDAYGGSLANRARLITEIADGIRAATSPDFVLGIKINSVEFQASGFSPQEAGALCELLEAHAFDFVELSGGTYEKIGWFHEKESSRAREAFFIEFAETITPHISQTKSYITGGLRTVAGMVDVLGSGIDGVGLGRAATSEPRLPRDVLFRGVKSCIQLPYEEDMGLGVPLSGAQMVQIARGQEPFDASDPEAMEAYNKDFAAFGQKMAADEKGELAGHVRIESLPVIPYVIEDPTQL